MLFWVFLGVLLVIVVSMGFHFFDGTYDGWVFPFFMWLVCSGLIAFLALMGFSGLAYINANELKVTSESRYELRALDSDSSTHGRAYFLGGGYVGEKRVLNYIVRNSDGSSELGHTDADKSKIWEDQQDKPYMLTIEKKYGNWWFAFDGGYRSTYEYQYHIPAGSVLESTKITNK